MIQMINIEWHRVRNRILGVLSAKRDTTVFLGVHKRVGGEWKWELSGAFIPDRIEPLHFDTKQEVEKAALKYWFEFQKQVFPEERTHNR